MRRIIGLSIAFAIVISLILVPATVFAARDGLGINCKWDAVKWETNQNSWKLYLAHWGRTPTNAMSTLAGLCGPDALCGSKCYDGAKRKLNTGNMVTTKTNPGCNGGGEVGLAQSSYTCKTCNNENGSLGSCPGTNCEVVKYIGANDQACKEGCKDAAGCRSDVSSSRCVMAKDTTLSGETEVWSAKCNGCWGVSTAFANTSWQNANLGSPSRLKNSHPNHRGIENSVRGGGDWGITGSNHPECASKIWAMQCNMKVGRTADDPVSRNCGYGKPCIDGCLPAAAK